MLAVSSPVDVQPPPNLAPILPPSTVHPNPSPPPDANARIQQGAAVIRNGSCLPDIEFNCAPDGYGASLRLSACCPSRLACQPSQGKILERFQHYRCCPPRTECPPERLCAKSSWQLYEHEGYFCCADGLLGYNVNGFGMCGSYVGFQLNGISPLHEVAVDPAAAPSLLLPFSEHPVHAPHSNAAIVGSILAAILVFAVVVRVTLVIMRQRRRSRVHVLSTEEDGCRDTTSGLHESHQLDVPRAVHKPPEKEHSTSFELQWTTIQSSRPGRSART